MTTPNCKPLLWTIRITVQPGSSVITTWSSPEFQKALQDNHTILVKWKDLQKVIND